MSLRFGKLLVGVHRQPNTHGIEEYALSNDNFGPFTEEDFKTQVGRIRGALKSGSSKTFLVVDAAVLTFEGDRDPG